MSFGIVSVMPTTSVSGRTDGWVRIVASISRPSVKICSAYRRVICPVLVSVSRRLVRLKSFSPSARSSVAICALIVGCASRSVALARAMLPSRATVQK